MKRPQPRPERRVMPSLTRASIGSDHHWRGQPTSHQIPQEVQPVLARLLVAQGHNQPRFAAIGTDGPGTQQALLPPPCRLNDSYTPSKSRYTTSYLQHLLDQTLDDETNHDRDQILIGLQAVLHYLANWLANPLTRWYALHGLSLVLDQRLTKAWWITTTPPDASCPCRSTGTSPSEGLTLQV